MTQELPPRIHLASLPTPLEHAERLSKHWGGPQIWIKRDDLTGFGLSGNKVRKLEFHFAAAAASGADTVITCGAVQSNHSRATALAAARLGYRCILLLRKPDCVEVPELQGNYLLDRLAGATIRFMPPNDWELRDELMSAEAATQRAAGHAAWVIPEGASDALGMWGFVVAMRELADQAVRITGAPATLWHAASSGGTTAGIGWAADRLGLDIPIAACSIGDSAAEIKAKVSAIWQQAAIETATETPTVPIEYIDRHIGGGYGIVSDEDLDIQAEATSLTGQVFDPTYTGKALVGLRREIAAGTYGKKDNIIFWHTGGGFAAFSHDFSRIAAADGPHA
ncbi:MAG: pyridoxal-phosphate dependent enzyme [bacterium]|nr:pyridoxal-phosphate dependent enzyme [bacterium]MCP4968779.1 pyridoxal-phosphate dependent enzyme [bacterium]